jgi:hypothetical protein
MSKTKARELRKNPTDVKGNCGFIYREDRLVAVSFEDSTY